MRKAFTLIELLLSAVVFALVGSLAMVTIATTVKLQSASRQSQSIALQASSVKNSLEQDLQHSVTDASEKYGLQVKPYAAAPFISYVIPNPEDTDSYFLRLICVEDVEGGHRLVRYTADLDSSSTQTATTLSSCDQLTVSTALGSTATSEYLTNDTTTVDSIQFKSVSASGAVPSFDPAAASIELTMHYSPALVSGEERVGQTKVNPLTFTYLIDRSSSSKYN